MPNIIGEPFLSYIDDQINERQTAHGSKSRTSDQLAYLNSKTAWVKLASSVKIDGTFKSTDPEIKSGGWDTLAKEYVLFSGFSSLNGSTLLPREKVFDKYSSKSFGLVPMPGIVDASVKCENRGSIKKATVNIKCYSPEQFRILEVLYLRLGYTVFLEFGWSSYLDGGTLKNTSSTLIETEFFNLQKGSKYVDFLKKIEAERKSKKGNYDGLLCKVSNFSWTFSQDGSYDIELSLITMGDVIESLKTNVKPSKDIVDLISEKYSLYGNEVAPTDAEAMDTNVPPAPAQDLISAYLFLQRVYVADKTTNPDYYSGKNDTGTTISGVAINVSNIFIKQGTGLKLKSSASDKDFLYFSYNDLENDEDVLNNEGFYIRFGHLINFIRDNIILKSKKSNEPIIEIDKDFETAKMYVFPYQVSLDPRVCIVGTKEWISKKAFYTNLPLWNDIKGFGANIANIYLNGAMVSRVLSEKKDEEGNISLYEMLNTICSELNRALGGVNNLETIIDEETMSIKIIDSSFPSIKPLPSTKLELYGYNGNKSNFVYDFNIKTEITNDFATMVTIGATAGGYAKGTENTMFSKWNKGLEDIFKEDYIPPTQTGDKDEDPPNNVYASEFWLKRYAPFGLTYPQDIEDDITTDDACALSPEIIDKNIELVSEFYKYCQYKIQQDNQKYASPTNGFIPISLGITLEGISGIKIYNAVNVDTRFLPSNYPNNLNFIIKGVNHKISDGKWETNLETVVIAKSEKEGILKYSDIRAKVLREIQAGVDVAKVKDAELTTHIQSVQIPPFTLESVTALITAAAAAFQSTQTIQTGTFPVTFSPSSEDDLWIYLCWQQGNSGAAQHYNVAKGTRKTYGLEATAIRKNWPGSMVASNGVTKSMIGSLHSSNPQKLAIAFIDVWKQQYAKKTAQAQTYINSSGKNRSGVPYADIKASFQRCQFGIMTWQKLANFGMIENGLNTDDQTGSQYAGMFQINKDYDSNPDNKSIIRASVNGRGHAPGFTEYKLDEYFKPLVPRIVSKFSDFVKDTGYSSNPPSINVDAPINFPNQVNNFPTLDQILKTNPLKPK